VLFIHQLPADCVNKKLFQSAIHALEAGNIGVALSKSKQLIEADPKDPYGLVLAADCFSFYGKEQEVLLLLQAAVDASEHAPIYSLLHSQQLHRMQLSAQSLDCVCEALRRQPSDSGLLLMQFELLCFLKKDREACSLVESSRGKLINHPDFHSLVIALYRRLGENQKALAEAQDWSNERSSCDALKVLADCWFTSGRHDRYVSAITEAAKCSENDPNLLALSLQAQLDASSKSIPAVLAEIGNFIDCESIDPGLALFCSRILLSHSDFSRGWSLYERRLAISPSGLYAPVETAANPLCSVEGEIVVLVAEQGVGDVIFFARFISQLLAEARQVVCLVDERLSALFRRCFPGLVIATNLQLAQHLAGDEHICLAIGSLPMRYAFTPPLVRESQQRSAFEPHPALKRLWMLSLPEDTLNVGLSLSAGLQAGSYKTLKRSVPVSVVQRALVDSEAVVHDLRHFKDGELGLPNIVSHDHITDDMEQLIALISALDILITSDQTNAFLAGLLGIPTLLIAPPNPHFAFMATGDSTPWFSSLVILRSSEWQGWDDLIPEFDVRFRALLNKVSRV